MIKNYMRLKKRNKRNEREREPETKEIKEEIPQVGTPEEIIYMYFEDEEQLEGYINYHKIKNFEYVDRPRTIKFQVKELIKEK